MTIVALTNNAQARGNVLLVEGTTNLWRNALAVRPAPLEPVIAEATDRYEKLHTCEALLCNDILRGGVSNTSVIAV